MLSVLPGYGQLPNLFCALGRLRVLHSVRISRITCGSSLGVFASKSLGMAFAVEHCMQAGHAQHHGGGR